MLRLLSIVSWGADLNKRSLYLPLPSQLVCSFTLSYLDLFSILFGSWLSCQHNKQIPYQLFPPHCIPPRLVSSVVSSWRSLGCKACWENAACCFVLPGTCFVFLLFLFCPMFSAVILFHFPFNYCQKSVFVRTFLLFVCRPSHSLSFLHSLCCSLIGRLLLILWSIMTYFCFMF